MGLFSKKKDDLMASAPSPVKDAKADDSNVETTDTGFDEINKELDQLEKEIKETSGNLDKIDSELNQINKKPK